MSFIALSPRSPSAAGTPAEPALAPGIVENDGWFYSTAKADLIERYRDYDTTATSVSDKKSMEWLDEAPGAQRRNAQWAIADIVGRTHLTVELI